MELKQVDCMLKQWDWMLKAAFRFKKRSMVTAFQVLYIGLVLGGKCIVTTLIPGSFRLILNL